MFVAGSKELFENINLEQPKILHYLSKVNPTLASNNLQYNPHSFIVKNNHCLSQTGPSVHSLTVTGSVTSFPLPLSSLSSDWLPLQTEGLDSWFFALEVVILGCPLYHTEPKKLLEKELLALRENLRVH